MEIRSVESLVQGAQRRTGGYLIVGGLAVDAHGFVRLTRDVNIVVRLTPENAFRALHALLAIGYRMSIPERPEAFADAAVHARWREEKHMIVLKLWSDEHRRTPIALFVCMNRFPSSRNMPGRSGWNFRPASPSRSWHWIPCWK